MVIVYGNLGGIASHRAGQFAGKVFGAGQHGGERGTALGAGGPGFDQRAAHGVGRIARAGPPVKVDAHHRLAQRGQRAQEGLLAGGQADVLAVQPSPVVQARFQP